CVRKKLGVAGLGSRNAWVGGSCSRSPTRLLQLCLRRAQPYLIGIPTLNIEHLQVLIIVFLGTSFIITLLIAVHLISRILHVIAALFILWLIIHGPLVTGNFIFFIVEGCVIRGVFSSGG